MNTWFLAPWKSLSSLISHLGNWFWHPPCPLCFSQNLRVGFRFVFFQTSRLIHPQILLILHPPTYFSPPHPAQFSPPPFFALSFLPTAFWGVSCLLSCHLPIYSPLTSYRDVLKTLVRSSHAFAWTLEWLAKAFEYNPNHTMRLEWPYLVFYNRICPPPLLGSTSTQALSHLGTLAMIVLCLDHSHLPFTFSSNVREASHDGPIESRFLWYSPSPYPICSP